MNLKRIITEFFNPRFSTEEIENSKLKPGLLLDLTGFSYADKKPGFPTLATGYVHTRKGHILRCNWDQHGKCFSNNKRVKLYDLIRPTRQKIDSSRTVGSLFIVGVFMILILIIIN